MKDLNTIIVESNRSGMGMCYVKPDLCNIKPSKISDPKSELINTMKSASKGTGMSLASKSEMFNKLTSDFNSKAEK